MSKNLALRILVALVGIPLLIFICYRGDYFLLGFTILLTALGGSELAAMLRHKGYQASAILSVLMPVAFVLAAHFKYPLIDLIVFSLFLISLLIIIEYSKNKNYSLAAYPADMFGRLLPSIYIGLLGAYIILVGRIDDIGGKLLIFTFLITWLTDTGAYFGGKNLGRHKLSVLISPNKTWEGFYFGLTGAIVAAVLSKLVFLSISWVEILVMAVLASLFGQIGDLFESAIKRHCDIKDSSSILPGHGGILDRFDSFLFAVPVIYYIDKFWH